MRGGRAQNRLNRNPLAQSGRVASESGTSLRPSPRIVQRDASTESKKYKIRKVPKRETNKQKAKQNSIPTQSISPPFRNPHTHDRRVPSPTPACPSFLAFVTSSTEKARVAASLSPLGVVAIIGAFGENVEMSQRALDAIASARAEARKDPPRIRGAWRSVMTARFPSD